MPQCVHTKLGPGLLEAAYEAALLYELSKRGLHTVTQCDMPVQYDEVRINLGFRIDMLVNDRVIVELIRRRNQRRSQSATADLPTTQWKANRIAFELQRKTHEGRNHPLRKLTPQSSASAFPPCTSVQSSVPSVFKAPTHQRERR
jgi:hypothetical protein